MQAWPDGVIFWERGWLSSNNTLLIDPDQAILIDSGYWTHSDQTLALLQSALGTRPLTGLVNTHLHSDHCGGNAALQQAYPACFTQVPPGHADFVSQWDPVALSYTPTGQHCPRFGIQGVITPGTSFEVAGRTWQAHAAPGHDPHSIVLFCPSEGLLISADALWENGFGVVFPEIEGDAAFDEVAATLDVIERLQPRLVLPGHGSAFSDVGQALARARKRLAGFVANPDKHASYAAKVLLKFKLLELQTIGFTDFCAWGQQADYLRLLHARHAAAPQPFDAWFKQLCESLVFSNAASWEGDKLCNAG